MVDSWASNRRARRDLDLHKPDGSSGNPVSMIVLHAAKNAARHFYKHGKFGHQKAKLRYDTSQMLRSFHLMKNKEVSEDLCHVMDKV